MESLTKVCLLISLLDAVHGTSIKMDFLPSGHVRTDPIISQDCVSDHVHTFYGANVLPYPDLVYDDLIAVSNDENTGNVEENKSLYWHPTVYRYDRENDVYERDEMAGTSSYYIWNNDDNPKAFPNGFRMIAGTKGNTDTEFPNANAECVNESPCLRDDCYTENEFFPVTACEELEVSMFFPGCWDGINLDSDDHMSHVAYSEDGSIDGDGKCPDSHPVRIPVIAFFFRIFEYDGGWHTFSDGSSIYHADYMSGWDENFLQDVLDDCENDSFGPNPNAFCENHITFRDAPKCTDEDKCDFADPNLLKKLKNIQPKLKNFKSISPEETKTVNGNLPRGTCNGTLLPKDDDDDDDQNNNCEDSTRKFLVNSKRRTCDWVATGDTNVKCSKGNGSVATHCPKTCGKCDNCVDAKKRFVLKNGSLKSCQWVKNKNSNNRCKKIGDDNTCRKTCGNC